MSLPSARGRRPIGRIGDPRVIAYLIARLASCKGSRDAFDRSRRRRTRALGAPTVMSSDADAALESFAALDEAAQGRPIVGRLAAVLGEVDGLRARAVDHRPVDPAASVAES